MRAALKDIAKMTGNQETSYRNVQYLEPQNHYAQWQRANMKERMLHGPINNGDSGVEAASSWTGTENDCKLARAY